MVKPGLVFHDADQGFILIIIGNMPGAPGNGEHIAGSSRLVHASHPDAHAAAIADRVLFLADGEIVRDLPRCSAHKILETLEDVTRR